MFSGRGVSIFHHFFLFTVRCVKHSQYYMSGAKDFAASIRDNAVNGADQYYDEETCARSVSVPIRLASIRPFSLVVRQSITVPNPDIYFPTVRCGGTLRGFDTDTWVHLSIKQDASQDARHQSQSIAQRRAHANPGPNIATHYCRLTCHRVRPCHRMERESSRINRDFARCRTGEQHCIVAPAAPGGGQGRSGHSVVKVVGGSSRWVVLAKARIVRTTSPPGLSAEPGGRKNVTS